MGRRWPSFKIPEHIAFYDKKTLAVLASRAGLELAETFPYHQAFPLGLIFEKLGFRLLARCRRMKLTLFVPGIMIAAVFRGR